MCLFRLYSSIRSDLLKMTLVAAELTLFGAADVLIASEFGDTR